MLTDPIADMLTRIRNATRARHKQVVIVPSSKMKLNILRIMKEENFIENYENIKDNRGGKIVVTLKYTPDKESAILGLKRISKPGRRIYVPCKEIPKVRGGLGVAILSTPCGILPDKQARRKGVGGELLCYIW